MTKKTKFSNLFFLNAQRQSFFNSKNGKPPTFVQEDLRKSAVVARAIILPPQGVRTGPLTIHYSTHSTGIFWPLLLLLLMRLKTTKADNFIEAEDFGDSQYYVGDPINGIIIGEFHTSPAAPLFLRYLHPKITQFNFSHHLVEINDDFDQTALIKSYTDKTDKLLAVVNGIKAALIQLKDKSAQALEYFEENITSATSNRILQIITYLKDNGAHEFDELPISMVYRIPMIPSRLEQARLFTEALTLNFTINGIDPKDTRDTMERCMSSIKGQIPRCFDDLLDEMADYRDRKMAERVKALQTSGVKFTAILGAGHVATHGVPMWLGAAAARNLLIFRPSPSKREGHGVIKKESDYCPLFRRRYTYTIQNDEEAETAALEVEKLLKEAAEVTRLWKHAY